LYSGTGGPEERRSAVKNKLDPKDAKAMRMKLDGKSNTEIAHALGHKAGTKNSGEAAVSRRLSRVKKSLALPDLLDKYGASDKVVIETAVAATQANRVISAVVMTKSDNAEVKTKKATARDCDFIEVPDHDVRLKASALIAKWKGWEKLTLQGPDGGPIELAAKLSA